MRRPPLFAERGDGDRGAGYLKSAVGLAARSIPVRRGLEASGVLLQRLAGARNVQASDHFGVRRFAAFQRIEQEPVLDIIEPPTLRIVEQDDVRAPVWLRRGEEVVHELLEPRHS